MDFAGNPVRISSKPKVLLLDVEGTTTPVSFVYESLFPYARDQLEPFLGRHFDDPEVAGAVDLLSVEHGKDLKSGAQPPPWTREAGPVTKYCEWLMDQDRKASGLKAIQGLIWKDGYESGSLKAPLFEDVVPALERWSKRGARIFIYSSGSVLAQKLLFSHSDHGNVTRFLSGYFDTTTGPKTEPDSYATIAEATGCPAGKVLFLSDSVTEVNAAEKAGMQTGLVARQTERTPENPGQHLLVSSFATIA